MSLGPAPAKIYSVTAFDVNSIQSGPSNIESPRNTKSITPQAEATNFENTATLTNNIVSRLGRTRGVPISLTGAAQLTLSRNVFSGFGPVLVERAGASVPPDTSSNFVIGVEPRGAR